MKAPDQPSQNQPKTNKKTILVLGGAGFIGRHALAAGAESPDNESFKIVIASRNPHTIDARIPHTTRTWVRREVRMEKMLTDSQWEAVLEDIDVVLNCVGILRQRLGETYEHVHHLAPTALATACKRKGIRLIHISALGLHAQARSRFLTSKLRGEQAIAKIGGDWFVVRPSLIDGPDGFGARWLTRVAQLPFFVVPSKAQGQIAAIHIKDLGEALINLSVRDHSALAIDGHLDREYGLGGEQSYTFAEYLRALRRIYTDRPNLTLKCPSILTRIGAHLCDLVHFSPFSFGHWELLHRDNVPEPNRLTELIDHEPRQVPSSDWKVKKSKRPTAP